jgi:hypothetical protein
MRGPGNAKMHEGARALCAHDGESHSVAANAGAFTDAKAKQIRACGGQ